MSRCRNKRVGPAPAETGRGAGHTERCPGKLSRLTFPELHEPAKGVIDVINVGRLDDRTDILLHVRVAMGLLGQRSVSLFGLLK